jgi:hypothetical protein
MAASVVLGLTASAAEASAPPAFGAGDFPSWQA